MSDPYIGQVVPVGFNFAPVGWLPCDGRLLDIAEYDTLFALIGTTYGGNGSTNFALPNLMGVAALGEGAGPTLSSYALGQTGGAEGVTLAGAHLPAHTHTMMASLNKGTASVPGDQLLAAASGQGDIPYSTAAASIPMAPGALLPSQGGGQPHENRQPLLCITYIIATRGQFPSPG